MNHPIMGYVVRMPQLGMSMEAGTVVEWTVSEGDPVEEGSVIAVVESEKSTAEIEAREAGVLRRILVVAGEETGPGDPIGIVAGPEEDIAEYLPDAAGAPASEPTADTPDATAPRPDTGRVKATPGARRLADQRGIDLAAVEGTGPQGVVTETDVEAAEPAGEPGVPSRTITETIPLAGIQRTVSERLSASARTAVHVTLNRAFDTTSLRSVHAAAEANGLDASITDLIVKAAGTALESHPRFNAVFEDDELRVIDEVNIGIAVDITDGLVTPVLPQVTDHAVETLAERRRELTDRTLAGEFTPDDLAGGTFTISNLGPHGVDHFTPVINPPQVAILGVGRIRPDETMTLSLSFDHRVVNGADAARFLDTLVTTLTDTEHLAGYYYTQLDFDLEPEPHTGADAGERRAPAGDARADETREIRTTLAETNRGTFTVSGLPDPVAFDEPPSHGGTGRAPTPVEHLLGALGSCLAIATNAMATRDDIPINHIETHVTGHPASGPLDDIELTLHLDTTAPADAIDTVVTKAERACYVERALADTLKPTVTWTRTNHPS